MSAIIPLKVYEILKEAVPGNIENFQYVLRVLALRDKNTGGHLDFVVKQANPDVNAREFHPVREAFLNEIYFYTKLWPEFQKLQEKIPPKLRINHLPKCLAATPQENFERIVLENLCFQNFVIHDRKKPFHKDTFEYIFKLYGRLHAISFAYKALHPEKFSELSNGVIDVWSIYLSKSLFHDAIRIAHEQSLKSLQPGVDDAVIEKYRHYIKNGVELAQRSLINSTYTCIIHGDCWSNNMMFKYDESGKLTDLRLLDFQNVRLGSPISDLSYCLYSGGTKETFDDLDCLLQIYHDSFSENLRAFGCDSNEVYPLED
ncbi:uncharacterized protein LOC108907558 [Anoplophora glabripennis]|uniref:uncharacterized protein LOC108907558 n=1 Tax=Anoplophora glabripennis TaxID=217634 RepID=UPI000874EE56|nr:uncharacterized protein LOC108907558 [Anoplophora glabripennis]